MKTEHSLWLILLLSVIPAYGSVACRSPDDYRIVRDYVRLDPSVLLSSIGDGFMQEDIEEFPIEEMFVVVSAEPEPPTHAEVGDMHEFRTAMAHVPSSVAYIHKIKGNIFFEYKLNDSRPEWRVRRGENLFSKSFGETTVHVSGQFLVSCKRRALLMVVPDLRDVSDETFREIVLFYDSLFPYPERLTIAIYERYQDVPRKLFRPSLHALKGGYGPAEKAGTYVWFTRGHNDLGVQRKLRRQHDNRIVSSERIE